MFINFIFLSGLVLSKMVYCSWNETGHSLSSDDEMAMKEKNQLIDHLIENEDYASSESVSNEINKEIKYFDKTKDTPPEYKNIWEAIDKQDLKAVDYFIRIKQIDPNLRGIWGTTLLHRASEYDNLEIVKYLVSKGADINARDNDSTLPLHWASFEGNLEIEKYFISELKMDPNSKGKYNFTCLHYAVASNNLEVVKFLIENGAKESLHEKNNNQITPLELAEFLKGKKELIEYLKSQMN